ncbi:unnamed protein product [Mycena citricolor]|uniref:Glycosylphosphatidylinositol anchor biosynthesis protein 11 n=1 Tax=Mycena citricolor TaxID=2018698 RepID=A0AAD2K7V6_9AGAR|nr:unnamed protein product [Mycena citricolor]
MPSKPKKRKVVPEPLANPPSESQDVSLGFFPLARYTSVVGVHTSLLAFSALFLPRMDFLKPDIDRTVFTSQDRPQHPFLDALTESPVFTLATMCLGAVVVQSWWAGWIRSWSVDYALHGSVVEVKLERERSDKQKLSTMINAWLLTGAASFFFTVVAIVFGAPLTNHLSQTYLLGLLLSILAVFPSAYALGVPDSTSNALWFTWIRLFAEFSLRSPIERALVFPALGTLIGSWAGAIPIALDWDRPWQSWPLTPAFGAICGYIASSVFALASNATLFLADEHRQSQRKTQ